MKFSANSVNHNLDVTQVYVLIVAPPSITPQSQTVFTKSGQSVLLACSYSGIPTPSIYWTVTDRGTESNVTLEKPLTLAGTIDLESGIVTVQTLTVLENGSLNISNVDDQGSKRKYKCVVINRLGVATGNVQLTLVGGMNVLPLRYLVCLFD